MKSILRVTVLLVVLDAPAGASYLPQAEPDPSLSPQDVVSIQIEALQQNDTPYEDRGIEVTLKFTSPANKRMTDAVSQFNIVSLQTLHDRFNGPVPALAARQVRMSVVG